MQKLWRKINFFSLWKISRRNKFLLTVSGLVFLGVFVFVLPAYAVDVGQWLALNFLLPITSYIGQGLLVLLELLIGIFQYNDFVNNPAVQTGWTVVRDICNMFFILVLLVIAFGTVFKIESYRYNRLLGRLIMMAVLINFSKMIAGFFIDLGQVVMMTFVNGFKDSMAGNFTDALAIKQLLGFNNQDVAPKGWESIGVGLLAITMLLVALIVIIVMLVVLIMRIVMLWILVVLSPLAYLLYSFPGKAQQYSSQWWNAFGKYVATGPVLAFFIWLALAVITGGGTQSQSGTIATRILNVTVSQEEAAGIVNNEGGQLQIAASQAGTPPNMLNFIISIAMFIGALMVAQQMGGVAGNFAGSAVGKMRGVGMGGLKAGLAPFKGGWELTKSQGRRAKRFMNENLPGWMNVPGLFRGMKERGAELDKQAKDKATARGREAFEQRKGILRLIPGRGPEIPHEERVESQFEAQYARDYAHMSKEQKQRMAVNLKDMKGPEGRRRRRALVRVAAEAGHIDDIMSEFKDVSTEYDKANPECKTKGNWHDWEHQHNFFKKYLGDDQQSMRLLGEVQEISKRTGHKEQGGHTKYNPDNKRWEWFNTEEMALAEAQKTPGRNQIGACHHERFGLREGYVINPETGKPFTEKYIDPKTGQEKERAMRVDKAGTMGVFEEKMYQITNSAQPKGRLGEHNQPRTHIITLGGLPGMESIDKNGYAHMDMTDFDRVAKQFLLAPQAIQAHYEKSGGEEDNFKVKLYEYETDKDGKEILDENGNPKIKSTREINDILQFADEAQEYVDDGIKGKKFDLAYDKDFRSYIEMGKGARLGDEWKREVNRVREETMTPEQRVEAERREQARLKKEKKKGGKGKEGKKVEEEEEEEEEGEEEAPTPRKTKPKGPPPGTPAGEAAEEEKRKAEEAAKAEAEVKEAKLPPEEEALVDKSLDKYEATKAKVEEYKQRYGGDGSEFFVSGAYNPEEHFSQDEFDQAQKLEQEREEVKEIGGVASFGSGKSNVIGINANTFAGEKYKGKAGLYVSDPTMAKEVLEEYEKSIEREMDDLRQKNPEVDDMLGQIDEWKTELKKPETAQNLSQRNVIKRQLSEVGKTATGRDALRLNNLMEAKARIRTEDPRNITIVNKDAVGYNARHIIAHEDSHRKLNELDKDGSLRKQMFEDVYSEDEREQVLDQVRQKMGNLPKKEAIKLGKETMSDEAAIRELFAEGMANSMESRADKSPDAIKLDPDLVDKVKKAGEEKGVKFMTSKTPPEVQAVGEAPSVLATKAQAKYSQMTQKAKGIASRIGEKAKTAAAPVTKVFKGVEEKIALAARERELKKQKKQFETYDNEAGKAKKDATGFMNKLKQAESVSKNAQLDYQKTLSEGNKEMSKIQKEIDQLEQERKKAMGEGDTKVAGEKARQIGGKVGQQREIRRNIDLKKVAMENAQSDEADAKGMTSMAVNIADDLSKKAEDKKFDYGMASYGGAEKRIKQLEEILSKPGTTTAYNEQNKEELAYIKAKLTERAKAKEVPVEIKPIPAKQYKEVQADIANTPVEARAEVREVPKEVSEKEEVKRAVAKTEEVEDDVGEKQKKETLTDEDFFEAVNSIEKHLYELSRTVENTSRDVGKVDFSTAFNEKIKKLQTHAGQIKQTDQIFGNHDEQRYFLDSFRKALGGLKEYLGGTKEGKPSGAKENIEKVEKKVRDEQVKI